MVGLDATVGRTTFYAAAVQACTKNWGGVSVYDLTGAVR
jgi:hypothetical protein